MISTHVIPLVFSLLLFSQDYSLNRSRARTSSIIQSGHLTLNLKEPFDHEEYGRVHKVKIRAKVTVGWQARSEKTEFHVPVDYFTEGFWDRLKSEDYIQMPEFKIKFLKSVSDKCNEVLIYESSTMQGFLGSEDPSIRSEICTDIGGIGAKWLDMKGSYQGFDYKAGFDLES